MNTFRRRRWLFPLIPLLALALFSAVVMLLWNAIIPGLSGWAALTYWKAMGLLVLCKILFGGFPAKRHGHGRPGWAHHRARMRMAWWRNLSEEEREQWKERRREWHATWRGMGAEERAKMKAGWKERCTAMRDKWQQMDPEERARFKDRMRQCRHRPGDAGNAQTRPAQ